MGYSEDKKIGERIKIALDRSGVSQRILAKETGKAEQTISTYIQGTTRIPVFVIWHVSRLTSASLDWLINGEGPEIKSERPPIINEDNEVYAALPEPIKKAIEVMKDNPGMAWEMYATILERAQHAERSKKKPEGQAPPGQGKVNPEEEDEKVIE